MNEDENKTPTPTPNPTEDIIKTNPPSPIPVEATPKKVEQEDLTDPLIGFMKFLKGE